jgi:hypothetical protein
VRRAGVAGDYATLPVLPAKDGPAAPYPQPVKRPSTDIVECPTVSPIRKDHKTTVVYMHPWRIMLAGNARKVIISVV